MRDAHAGDASRASVYVHASVPRADENGSGVHPQGHPARADADDVHHGYADAYAPIAHVYAHGDGARIDAAMHQRP